MSNTKLNSIAVVLLAVALIVHMVLSHWLLA